MSLFLSPNPCPLRRPYKSLANPPKSLALPFNSNPQSHARDPNASSRNGFKKPKFVDKLVKKSVPEPEIKLNSSGLRPPKNVDGSQESVLGVELGGHEIKLNYSGPDSPKDAEESDNPGESTLLGLQLGNTEIKLKVSGLDAPKGMDDERGETSVARGVESGSTETKLKLSEQDAPKNVDERGEPSVLGVEGTESNLKFSGQKYDEREESSVLGVVGGTESNLKIGGPDPPGKDDERGESSVLGLELVGGGSESNLKLSEEDAPKNVDESLLNVELGGTETKLDSSDPDPPKDVDERVETSVLGVGKRGSGSVNDVNQEEGDRLRELKRALLDAVYGSDLGLRASAEIRAEALELVSQLEAANPTPEPTQSPELLHGNWILVYTAFSELLPLLAVGSIPLVQVEKIVQVIDTRSLTITNSATIATPASTSTFSASASFEVRSPSRIQVQFKEGTIRPPEIKSRIELPETINIVGQNISLSSLQQVLNPLENTLKSIAPLFSGLQPVKIPIAGEPPSSWLLITYLDEELRISRGDGGLFVLVKQGD